MPAPLEIIGVLLLSSVGGALANLGITMAGRVPINLNFTVGRAAMESAVDQCGIRTILTSRVFLAKLGLGEKMGTDNSVHGGAEAGQLDRGVEIGRAHV